MLYGAIVALMGVTSFSVEMAAALFLHQIPMNAEFPTLWAKRGDRIGSASRAVRSVA